MRDEGRYELKFGIEGEECATLQRIIEEVQDEVGKNVGIRV